MADLFEPLAFTRGRPMKNRFMLAPLTNSQSNADGTMSDDEFNWLTYRATGGFGLVMTCAAHVQRIGNAFPGQLGVFSDDHLPGLTKLAAEIKARGSLSSVQLHHGGIRCPEALIGEKPVGPSEDAETGARALSEPEVQQLIEDFIAAAVRSEKAGFDGVEIHGAHGYILCDFLSSTTNKRTDRYGGSFENRSRIVFEIIKGIRARTGKDFQLGLRLSPERFGMKMAEQLLLAEQMMTSGDLDYLDMSLWDAFKAPGEPEYAHKSLIEWFAELPRGNTKLGVAGKITSAEACRKVLAHGVDFPLIGRGAILHHDFPERVKADVNFKAIALPVTRDYLRNERLGPVFVEYMNTWKGFVVQDEAAKIAAR
ncbi:MAG: NADH:flavin oxidoreductase [Parvibaculaceae bacterium]